MRPMILALLGLAIAAPAAAYDGWHFYAANGAGLVDTGTGEVYQPAGAGYHNITRDEVYFNTGSGSVNFTTGETYIGGTPDASVNLNTGEVHFVPVQPESP